MIGTQRGKGKGREQQQQSMDVVHHTLANLQARHDGEGKALRQNSTAGIEKQGAESMAETKLARA